jgi:hypothetical protein
MSDTYAWVIEQLDRYPEKDGHTDVVFVAHWRLNGTDGVNTATVYGSVGLTYEEGAPFTPYEDLTEDQVVGWVQAALGPEQVQALTDNVAAQLAAIANPPVVTPPLPWDAPAA